MARSPTGFRAISTDHLKCRSLNHAWDVVMTVVVRVEGRRAYRTSLVCLRCGTERADTLLTTDGEVDGRRYTYAPGYLIQDVKKWGGRWEFTRNARVELFGRFIEASGKKGAKP